MTGGFDELFGDTSTAIAAPTEKKAKTADSAARPAAVDRPQQSQADHDGEVRAAADRYMALLPRSVRHVRRALAPRKPLRSSLVRPG